MVKSMPHDIMGYDRAITVFSPDGRILQVEYAKKTVSQGATTIGMVCKDEIVLMADKKVAEKLIVPESVEKIFQIDKHIGSAATGIMSDGRTLIQRAQTSAQNHKIIYDESIDVMSLVKDISDQQHIYTQYGGVRPFGVALLIGGVDKTGARLFLTEPSGIYFEYKATSIGEGAQKVKDFLESNYKETISTEEGIKLGMTALKNALGKEFSKDRIDVAVICKNKGFKKLTKSEIEKMLK